MSALKTLSAREFYWSILSGGKRIIEHQEEINKINVYPVPDADTGSNMAATVTSVIYNSKEEGTIKEVAESIGNAALDGARGNSGVIFAQFLYALGREMTEKTGLTTKKFGEIVKKATNYVYEAVPHPQEGTILTVIREWGESVLQHSIHVEDFEDLLMKAEIKAQEALENTAQQLEALKLAKVVDAGAKGFVVFLEGVKETIMRRAFTREAHDMEHLLSYDIDAPFAEAESLTEESLHNRFCTETCIIGENIDKKAVLDILEKDSDSIVTAGSEQKLRLHFHTNNPDRMFEKLRSFGDFSFQKVEDMRLQYNVTHHRKTSIALIIDSGIAAGNDFIEQEQIHVVPLTVQFPEGTYLDGRTLTTEALINRMEKDGEGKTSQPSPKAFADVFSYVSHYYDSAIVLTMAPSVSGTYNSALQALKMAKYHKENFRIDVVSSKSLSAGGGAVAQALARDIASGKYDHDQILQRAKNHADNLESYVNFRGVDHMIRSGRLGAYAGYIVRFFNLSPFIMLKDSVPKVMGAGVGFERSLKKSLKTIKKHLAEGRKPLGFVCSHLVTEDYNPEQLQTYVRRISYLLEMEPWSVNLANPAMAPNVGFGAVAIGIIWDK